MRRIKVREPKPNIVDLAEEQKFWPKQQPPLPVLNASGNEHPNHEEYVSDIAQEVDGVTPTCTLATDTLHRPADALKALASQPKSPPFTSQPKAVDRNEILKHSRDRNSLSLRENP